MLTNRLGGLARPEAEDTSRASLLQSLLDEQQVIRQSHRQALVHWNLPGA